MTKWEDERAATMLSGPQASKPQASTPLSERKRTPSQAPDDAGVAGTWAIASSPDSNEPTSPAVPPARHIHLAPGECPDENVLVQLAEGRVGGLARSSIDRHLDTCAECSRLVIELAKLAAPTRSAPKRYNVIRQLGQGAMGVVWEAEDTHLHRKVALKFVKPEGIDDKALRKRLLREARALAQVRHPNVMAVYDAGESDDEVCLVLELVVGSNARVWRSAKPRSLPEILSVWRQAAAGIAAVHKAGIIHRDIKPDNVFVSEDHRVLVGDFGLARGHGVDTTTSLTVSGAVIGTPLYMSPEQLHGAVATQKSDQFALCASIWEAVLDERPFRGTTIAAIVLAMQKIPEIPKTATPEQRRVLAILQKGLDPDPTKRFDNIEGLAAALEAPEPKSRTSLWIGIGAVVLSIGGTVAVLASLRGGTKDLGGGGSGAGSTTPGSALPAGSATGSATPGSATGSATPGSATGSAIPGSATGSATPGSATGSATPGAATGSATPVSAIPAGSRAGSATPSGSTPTGSAMAGSATAATPSAGSAATIKLDPTERDPKGQLPVATRAVDPTPKLDPIARTTPDPNLPTDYTTIMTRAADRLNFGDGAGCLKLLANLPELPDDEMRRVELARSNCRMAAGDCVGAAAAIEKTGKQLGWEAAQIKTTIESTDKVYCPIDAPPQARWGERAQHRLQAAAGLGRSCKVVLDTIAKHKIALPDQKSLPFLEVQCAVNVNDCARGKALWVAWMMKQTGPSANDAAAVEAGHAKSFHNTFSKKCPP